MRTRSDCRPLCLRVPLFHSVVPVCRKKIRWGSWDIGMDHVCSGFFVGGTEGSRDVGHLRSPVTWVTQWTSLFSPSRGVVLQTSFVDVHVAGAGLGVWGGWSESPSPSALWRKGSSSVVLFRTDPCGFRYKPRFSSTRRGVHSRSWGRRKGATH